MIALLWARVQGWMALVAAAVLVVFGAYAAGGRAARRSAEHEGLLRQAAAREKADVVRNTVGAMDDDAVVRRLGDRWVRKRSSGK